MLPKFLQGILKVGQKTIKDPIQMGEEMAKCECIGWGCCPGPFIKLAPIDGGDESYIWNDGASLIIGTKAQFEAAVAGQ
jgi:hypothetical protein